MKISFFQDFNHEAESNYLTSERLMAVLNSEQHRELMEKVREARGTDQFKNVKQRLPFITPHCYSTNGSHKRCFCLNNGLASVDVDHITNPKQVYEEKVAPHKDEIQLLWAFITPSGEGLRLICRLHKGLSTLEENQQYIGQTIGLTIDPDYTGLERISFLPGKEEMLYFNDRIFTEEPAFTLPNPAFISDIEDAVIISEEPATIINKVSAEEASTAMAESEEKADENGEEPNFRGVSYKKIINDYFTERGGIPMPGERHNEVLKCLHVLKYICDFDADKMLVAIGDAFGLEEAEIKRMIKDVLAYPCENRNRYPYSLYKILHRHGAIDDITEIESEKEEAYPVDEAAMPYNDLPPVVKQIIRITPEGFKTAVFFELFIIIGFLFTRLRTRYWDGVIHSMTLMGTLEAPATAGKSFAGRIFKRLTRVVKAKDEEARAEWREYEKAMKKAKNSRQQPEEPKSFVRIIPGRSSVSKTMERSRQALGLHCISYDSEVSTVIGNQKQAWANKSSFYRNSFDNDDFGQDYKSDNATSDEVTVLYNFFFCGTPNQMDLLYNDHENGFDTRSIPTTIPDNFGQRPPQWGTLSKREETMIDKFLEACEMMTFDEMGNIRPEQNVKMDWLFPVVNEWIEEMRIKSIRNGSHAMDTLRKRSAVMGFRIATMAYQLFCCKKACRGSVERIFQWAATAILNLQMNRFGAEIEAVYEARCKKARCVKVTGNKSSNLFDSLQTEFTSADIDKAKLAFGLTRAATKIISDWTRTGLCQKIAPGRWKKISA